ncbi:hypothetical protein C1H46_034431 [Malus baccata]|uniref:J domain-containing protein n=1 Tax=Malus baccata TaxID=106549 RepID=A0A540L0L1_MALBA|nr:hypothetical protein C1H46_034431 [Malus baccata]
MLLSPIHTLLGYDLIKPYLLCYFAVESWIGKKVSSSSPSPPSSSLPSDQAFTEAKPRHGASAASLYEVLRVTANASPTKIKSAYRSLAKQYHQTHRGRSPTAGFHPDSQRLRHAVRFGSSGFHPDSQCHAVQIHTSLGFEPTGFEQNLTDGFRTNGLSHLVSHSPFIHDSSSSRLLDNSHPSTTNISDSTALDSVFVSLFLANFEW